MLTHYRTCSLCEAACGVEIAHDGFAVHAIRGDRADTFSHGHICPKAVALQDLHDDPDRLRYPLRRTGRTWQPIAFKEAYALAGSRLAEIQRRHGKDAVAGYFGNPVAHSHGAMFASPLLMAAMGTRNRYSASSADQLPHMFAAFLMFGNQLLFNVPDLDRCELLVVMGANPAVSNGSAMTAGDVMSRIKAIQGRGGRVIVIDPRRSETARMADAHHYIRPGTDALLLLAALHTIFSENLSDTAHLTKHLDGISTLRELANRFPAERVAPDVGIDATTIAELARGFAGARRAAWYGRFGVCTQAFGGLSAWLLNAINIVSGHFDRPGGMMFPSPAVDLAQLASLTGQRGSYDRWRSRVSGRPEFGGELPVAVMAEEMETPGRGQVRGLVTVAGNPALSALQLIGRRQLRSNNSWLHNSARLIKGKNRCTLLMHPDDAQARCLVSGQRVVVRSRIGEASIVLAVDDHVMPGVVSIPHGWGHHRQWTRLRVAEGAPGTSINDLTDDGHSDALTGTVAFSGVPVWVSGWQSGADAD